MKVVEKIGRQVVPSKKMQTEQKKIADLVILSVKEQAAKYDSVVDVEIGGSYAKGTWLAGADIDVFIKFKDTVSEQKFRGLGEKIGFDALKKYRPYVRYSEHPYVEASIQKTTVNVVPCYNVKKGMWKSSADRSQFHTKFMLKSLDVKKQDEVRILKQFLKSNKIYGAEISRQGFSGYVSEVLIWNLESFAKVIEKFATIQKGSVIGKVTKTFDTTIIIADPVDGKRNLAAAISDENVTKMILASRAFLRKPSPEFFKTSKSKLSEKALKQVIVIEFKYAKRSPDIIWGQIKKASVSLRTQLNVSGFNVVRNSAASDGKNLAILAFLFESHTIPQKQIKKGPEIFKEKAVADFINKNLKCSDFMWIDKTQRVISMESRRFASAEKFLEELLTCGLSRSGIPKGLRNDVKNGFTISSGGKKLRRSIKEELLEIISIDEKIFSAYK